MSRVCSVEGCQSNVRSRGLCSKHYMRMYRYGDPTVVKTLLGEKARYRGYLVKYKREYISYRSMITRCHNKNHSQYKDYGGRGIKVYSEWLEPAHGFLNFINDMGVRPEDCSLDRIDVDGDYCPENCRWATREEQSNNMRGNRRLVYNGQTHTIAEWARVLEMPSYVIYNRIHLYKWSVEKALSAPYKRRK